MKYILLATDDLPAYIIGAALGLILLIAISYYFYRWIFSIKRQLWNQRKTVFLLAKIAEKSGAIKPEEAEQIVKQLSGPDEKLT